MIAIMIGILIIAILLIAIIAIPGYNIIIE